MPLVNSYQRGQGPIALLLADRETSIGRVNGPTVLLLAKRYESYQRLITPVDFDSSNTVVPRVESFVQRTGDQGDQVEVIGKIYNSNGGAVALVGVEYSQVSAAGPWLPVTVLSGDPSYNFPSPGGPAGTPFNIPIKILDNFTGDIWVKVEISSPLPNTEDVGGPFGFIYPVPGLPAFITVPAESSTGNFAVEWGAAAKATFYNLEEATQADFSDAAVVYSGPNLTFSPSDRDAGTYYYRVQGVNAIIAGPYLEGSNPTVVTAPATPVYMTVPSLSTTGQYVIAWNPVQGANIYELQESYDAGFAVAKTIYNGPKTSFSITKKEEGTFYYRVRAGRV